METPVDPDDPGPHAEPFISTAEAAHLLGFTRQYIGRMFREGRLSGYRTGGVILVNRKEVIRMADLRAANSPEGSRPTKL